MRWLLAPLVVATGCNWVYGLDQTIAVDAPEFPPGVRTKLVWGIATTDGQLGATALDPELAYPPIGSEMARPMPPTILVGDDSGLSETPYAMQDGSFEIPYALRESPHRILYTLPGESVPHEVQWAITGAFLVVPRTTRLDAPAPPNGSGYKISPVGLPGQLVAPVLATSGAFTYSNSLADFDQDTPGSVIFPFAQSARALTAPLGAPQKAKGDWVLLADYASRTAAQSSIDAWALTQIDLSANAMAMPATEPTWQTTERTLSTIACSTVPTNCLPSATPSPTAARLDAILPGGTPARRMQYGVSPSTELPGFLPGVAPLYIERPLILAFAESTQIDTQITLAEPTGLGLDRVLTARLTSTRTVNGAMLTSAIQTITNVFSGTLQFSAPLAINVQLGSTSLSGTSDSVPFAASSSLQSLKWSAEAGYSANDHVVTLYEITGSALAPVRIYHVIAPEVKVDGSLLAAGHHYVFAITSRTGLGGAMTGDYAKANLPFGSSTTFARTFVVQ